MICRSGTRFLVFTGLWMFLFLQLGTLCYSQIKVSIASYHNVTCFGDNNGWATAAATGASGPVSFSWGPGIIIFSSTATGLAPGTYYVVAADTISHDSAFVTITQPTLLVASVTRTNITCPGLTNGTASLTTTGGTAPYTYNWNTNPIQTTSSITGLAAGTYQATITDTNACSVFASATISQPGGFIHAAADVCNKLLTAVDSLGSGSYTWIWNTNPVQTTKAILATTSGFYEVVATDSSNCSHLDTVTITLPTPPPIPVVTLDGGNIVTTGSPPFQWMLQGIPIFGVTDSAFHPSVNGIYTVKAGTPPCTSTSAPFTLTTAGIESYSQNRISFRVSPNPAVGETELFFTSGTGTSRLYLHVQDMSGRAIGARIPLVVTNGSMLLNLNDFPAGIYFLSLEDATGTAVGQQKLVITN